MSKKGEVTYEVRADDSNLESDLKTSQKKVENSLKETSKKSEDIEKDTGEAKKQVHEDVTQHNKNENEKQVQDNEKAGQKCEDSARNHGESIKGIASGVAKGIGVAMLAVGTAAVGIGVSAVNSAVSMDQAMNQFIASTGKGKEETERYQNVLEDIYKNNYGESFEDIGQAMSEVNKQLGDMDDASLQEITESAFALRDTFEYDISESTRAAKALMDNFGTSGEEAMSLIAAGAQNGLDYSGELLDSISEYSVQFAKVGLDADDMFKIFQKGAETGAWNLDKIGDAIKEMSIRVIDGSETTKQGFEAIGLNADEMAAKFAAGGDSAKEAFNQTIAALASMEDPLAQNAAGVNLFGTMWEDLGPEVVTQLANIEEGAYDTADAMNGIKEVKYEDLGSMFEALKRSVEMLILPIGEQLIPILSELIEATMPIIEEVLPPLVEMLEPIISLFTELLSPILTLISSALVPLVNALMPIISVISNLLMPVLQSLMSVFSSVFSGILGIVTSVIGNITGIFQGIIDFIKCVFTGDWEGAWNAIVDIFSNLIDGIANIFKTPINWIIDGINAFIGGINSIKIPDWVPLVGGKGFNIPTIPRLRVGMDYVPSDDFPALLHKGEAVLTAQENALYKSAGGFEGIMHALSTPQGGGDTYVTVENGQNVPEIDYDKLGAATADAIHKSGMKVVVEKREIGRVVREVQN